jgi:glycosyltransferase involved in cell wall biosynthesis
MSARVLLLGPSREALSGVSTHVSLLMGSALATEFRIEHFQVGSEGRAESPPRRLARLAWSPFALGAGILRSGAQIVHINTSLNAGAFWRDLAYAVAARLCGARAVYQVHGGALRRFTAGWRPLASLLLRLPDAVVVVSQAERGAWSDIVPGQDVTVVPNGIDGTPYRRPEAIPSSRMDARAPLKLVYLGRLASGKGLEESLSGLAIARDAGVRAQLVIAGAGPEERRLREQVAALGIAGEVSFPGPAHGEWKRELLGRADVLLLPSYSEGLPYALLEGMAAGAVPVATPVGGIPDVVQGGVHGILVPVGDAGAVAAAIAKLARDRTALARMSAACRERVAQTFSIERTAQDFGVLYRRLEGTPWAASPAG